MKNLKEFKELIERYETIQLQEIEAAFANHYDPIKFLTGFGNYGTCTLCIAVTDEYKINCIKCVYGKSKACCIGDDKAKRTYNKIENANTPEELLTAYRNRAKFMRKLLKEKGVDYGTGS